MNRRFFLRIAAIALVVVGVALAFYLASPFNEQPSKAPPHNPSHSGMGVVSKGAAGPTSVSQILASGDLQKGNAETRLIEVLSFIETGDLRTALQQAERLTRDHPNFNLAHLLHGDLLKLRYEPDATTGGTESAQTQTTSARLQALQTEIRARLDALRERPPTGHIPQQFVTLSSPTRHAIAVDASRSRLYLFENTAPPDSTATNTQTQATPPNLKLIGDFFISVGKAGIHKRIEGDGKTPVGAYYITSVRERKTLPEFYGAGALPINYPNAVDTQLGRTGSGIWLHGTPPQQYVRAPLASDGCVVLSNPDMEKLLALVAPRTTPVVIAERLQWVPAAAAQADATELTAVLSRWIGQKKDSDATPKPLINGFTQLSILKWEDAQTHAVTTFEETANGQPTGVMRRQYWSLQPQGWTLTQDTQLSGPPTTGPKRMATLPQNSTTKDRPKTSAAPLAPSHGVQQVVEAWAKAWSQKNMVHYLAAYAPSFVPPGGISRKAWEQERRERIVSKGKIVVGLSKLTIQTNGNTAVVNFVQSYKADQLAVSSHKTLQLIKRGDQWLITQESVGGR